MGEITGGEVLARCLASEGVRLVSGRAPRVLGGLERVDLPTLNAAFDELAWFTLAGIARRRGEVLPTRLAGV